MKSESYLTLHRQQHNWNVPMSRNVVNTSVKPCDISGSTSVLRCYKNTQSIFLRKENKNNNLLNHSSPPSYVFHHFIEYHNALEVCTGSKLKPEPGPYPRLSDPTRPDPSGTVKFRARTRPEILPPQRIAKKKKKGKRLLFTIACKEID